MSYRITLPSENSDSLCSLPNGSELYLKIRLRPYLKQWTIQLADLDKNDITDERPLVFNPDLFKQYSHLRRKYGSFSIEENNPGIFSLENALNNSIHLFWTE